MGNKLINAVGRNLREPTSSFTGFLVVRWVLKRKNAFLSESAASLCKILPDHQVLELGFGPGIGLKKALQYVSENGSGKVYGVDYSSYMVDTCSKSLAHHISAGNLELSMTSVENMPYNNDKFDRVFHCNCYYFWEDMHKSCAEIYRVMKPHSLMVTTVNLKSLNEARDKGFMKKCNTDPLMYMTYLENVGFKNVEIKYLNDSSGKDFQAIFAYIEEKE